MFQSQQINNDLSLQNSNGDLQNLLNEVADGLLQSEETLRKGEEQKKIRENFMAQANASYEKADQAVKLSAKILEEAQQTLNTLKGYCKTVIGISASKRLYTCTSKHIFFAF